MVSKNIPQFLAPWCLSLEKSAGAVVFREHDGQRYYLTVKYRHGHWEFPRGHVEEGESEEQTARREVREETGLTDLSLVKNFRHEISFWYLARGEEMQKRIAQKHGVLIFKKVIFFLAQTPDQEIQLSDEHGEHLWLPFDDALAKLTYQNAKNTLTAAHAAR